MKNLFAALMSAICLLIVASPVNAEIQTFEGKGQSMAGDIETQDQVIQRARQKAIEDVQSKAGVYIKSFAQATNSNPTAEDILAITKNTLKVTDVYLEKSLMNNDTLIVTVRVKATLDTDEITKWFDQNVAVREKIIAEDTDLQKEIADRDRRIAELERQLAERKKLDDKPKPVTKPETNQQVGGKIFTGVGEYRMGSSETIIDAERGARILAMQNALERAGVLLSTYSKVKDLELDKDIITTKSRAVLKVVEAVPTWTEFVCRMTVKVDINVEELNKWLAQEAKKS